MRPCKPLIASCPDAKLLWASPRELLSPFHAEDAGAGIISMTHGLLAKLTCVGKDLGGYSVETVEVFRGDAVEAGYDISLRAVADARA